MALTQVQGGMLAGSTNTTTTIQSNGTTAITIDSSQNVGIGTASPSVKLHVDGTGNQYSRVSSSTHSNFIQAGCVSGSTFHEYKSVYRLVDTDAGERMRINSSGNLLVGATSTVDSERLNVTQSGSFPTIYSNNTNASNAFGIRVNLSNYFFNTANLLYDGIEFSNVRFRVYSNGGIANYQANDQNLSDQREKKNIELAPNYLDKICQIPVKTFLYINQTDAQKTLGVIAQDVQAIAPELVDEADWSENVDGSKMRLSIYQTDLQYALMKAIQELKAIVDTQAAEIAALKAVK